MRILWLLACLTIGLVSPAESALRAASPMAGDGVPRTGTPGPQGDPGAVGPQGDPGQPGVAGPKGDAGNDGPKGNTGAAGAAGAAGPAGTAGTPGATGPAGPAGAKGEPGSAGSAGPQGLTGAKGDAGSQGLQGPQGLPGGVGPRGDAGAAGAAGAKGDTGAAGLAGAPKRIERYTATSTAASVATFTWAACTTTPDVDVIPTWAGDQMVVGGVTAQTLSSATVAAKRSKGTVLLAAGPFEPAPSTPITIRVICN